MLARSFLSEHLNCGRRCIVTLCTSVTCDTPTQPPIPVTLQNVLTLLSLVKLAVQNVRSHMSLAWNLTNITYQLKTFGSMHPSIPLYMSVALSGVAVALSGLNFGAGSNKMTLAKQVLGFCINLGNLW